ncbi:hypothetical protein FPQ18DRAFT_302890 [Pyronema domesticum]|nr:hypothetical protein FPQ18DRAFT_302890 [Pyronema domesticum]
MCRVDPEIYWRYVTAENEYNPTFEQVHKTNHYVYLRNHRPYGPLISFKGCCPICRPKDHRRKPLLWRTQDPSIGSLSWKSKGRGGPKDEIEQPEEDMRGISKEFGGVGVEEERGGMKWIRLGISAIMLAFLMLLFLCLEQKRNNAFYEECMNKRGEY